MPHKSEKNYTTFNFYLITVEIIRNINACRELHMQVRINYYINSLKSVSCYV